MRNLLILSIAVGVLLGSFPATGRAEDPRRRKKLIATGWDYADPARLRENLSVMEARPFDGVVIDVTGRINDKRACALPWAFVNEKWQREWFRKPLEDLKACPFKRFTDNFILFGANPGNVDWFDDEGWANIVDHWRIAAWLVKESRLKGILFDPEPYAPPAAQFTYSAQAQRDKHTFGEYCAKARQRGREVMQAVCEECPDITLFCYFVNSIVAHAIGQADPKAALQREGYGLYPAFIDGWLDAAKPGVTFVDGCENAYRYNSVTDFLEAGTTIKGDCQELVSRENRAKYRAQVQTSFGIYLDAYWNPKGSPWIIDGLGGPRVNRLRENVRTALRVADEYVWIYGEKFRWWPTPNKGVREQTWPEALPGCEDALAFARDPVDYALRRIAALRKDSKLTDLARNGDFSSDKGATFEGASETWKPGRPPAGWNAWQDDKSKGTFAWDRDVGATAKGAARAEGVANGCFLQSHPAKPGQTFALQAGRKLQGRGQAWMRVRWQTAEGSWTAETKDKVFSFADAKTEWSQAFGVVEVPSGVGRLVLLLCISDQAGADDVAWFDDVSVYQVE